MDNFFIGYDIIKVYLDIFGGEFMDIGSKIKTIRKEKKLTQKALGELIGKSEISIRKYEASSNVPLDVILDIAKVLNVDVAGLIPEAGNKDPMGSLKRYLESRNYFINDDAFLKEIEYHILEYIKFKIYEKNNKSD